MPTDLTFCEHCNDSGDVLRSNQGMFLASEYIDCPECPRCSQCDSRAYLGAQGGKVGDEWVCSPEHAAATITGGYSHEHASPVDLEDAAQMLREMGDARLDGKDFSPRDYMLLARACALMAGSIVQDAHRFTEPPSIAEGTLSEFLPTLLGVK